MINPIAKVKSQMGITYMGMVVGTIVNLHLSAYGNDMNKAVEVLSGFLKKDEDDTAKYVCQVIKAFGTEMPSTTDYPEFAVLDKKLYVPSGRMVRKDPQMQINWNKACQWAKDYARNQAASIIGAKDSRLKELQQEINKLDEIIEKQTEIIKLNKEIAKQNELIKLNKEIEK